MSGSKNIVRLFGATATLILAAGCGSSVSSVSNTTVTPGARVDATKGVPAAPGGVLHVASTALGPILVNRVGRTVYLLMADSPGHSTCSSACLKLWPLVPAPVGASVPTLTGVSAALATTKATSGVSMVTAGGWPLYTFVKDTQPGQVAGEGVKAFGGTWYAVSPAGKAVTAAANKAPATTTVPGGAGGGY